MRVALPIATPHPNDLDFISSPLDISERWSPHRACVIADEDVVVTAYLDLDCHRLIGPQICCCSNLDF